MLGTALLLQAAELGAWLGLYRVVKRQATRQVLVFGRPQPVKIPIVDAKLKTWAGHPSKTSSAVARRMVSFARKLVNTSAFEHVVAGLANPDSPIRRRLQKKRHYVHVTT